jgi:hypothetical protein
MTSICIYKISYSLEVQPAETTCCFFHILCLWVFLEQQAYFVSAELIVKIDILGSRILPIFRVPATSIPVHDPYNFIAVDKNIGAT